MLNRSLEIFRNFKNKNKNFFVYTKIIGYNKVEVIKKIENK